MKLTAHIKDATDGWFDLRTLELPELQATAHRVEDIPEAVREAAAKITGKPASEFDVEVSY
ncbi:hypothetical protein [Pseudarthrobacter sp. NPDC058119]|uniref:hypothetical protein n=1 Tax=Pseudarthrobacter sp. NPDC058119 TaxID=3346348 RepID=UPI0036DD7F7F